MTAFAITFGQGRDRPQGFETQFTPPPVDSVFQLLSQQPARVERWWSPHQWDRSYRTKANWRAAVGVCVDADYRIKNEAPPADVATRFAQAARDGRIPGNIFHMTPHGARVVFVYEVVCTDSEMQVSASKGACAMVERALAEADLYDYEIDDASWDLARFFYTHNSIAKGVTRTDELILMRRDPYEVDALCAEEPPESVREPAPAPATTALAIPIQRGVQDAIAQWNADHRQDWPTRPGQCPACGHNDCFHALPNTDRWHCFSTGHPDTCGVRSNSGFHGDALDLEAYVRGCKPVEVLRADGYLSPPRAPARSHAAPTPLSPPAEPAEPAPAPAGRPWRSRSYLTAVQILASNARDVLEGRHLEANELTGRPELGRRPLTDTDVARIRSLIEARFVGGLDKENREIGLQLSKDDIATACEQVAAERGYNPLREYLTALAWDGTERIARVAEEVLGVEASALNIALLRRWFVSAVARALSPGCKVDTVIVLVGRQGVGKSTFFRTLAGPWFSDSAVDIRDKDSFQALRGVWIYEWAELEALNRARDANAAKAFLSSQIDRYRPSYGRLTIDVARTCVIVGSTNDDEFLTDSTGNRRFWPIEIGEVNVSLLEQWRDHLWAEAVAAYRAHEPWWLSPGEGQLLAARQYEFTVSDEWDEAVLSYDPPGPFTTSDVLRHVLKKDIERWTRQDARRICDILRRAGFRQTKPHKGTRLWVRSDAPE